MLTYTHSYIEQEAYKIYPKTCSFNAFHHLFCALKNDEIIIKATTHRQLISDDYHCGHNWETRYVGEISICDFEMSTKGITKYELLFFLEYIIKSADRAYNSYYYVFVQSQMLLKVFEQFKFNPSNNVFLNYKYTNKTGLKLSNYSYKNTINELKLILNCKLILASKTDYDSLFGSIPNDIINYLVHLQIIITYLGIYGKFNHYNGEFIYNNYSI